MARKNDGRVVETRGFLPRDEQAERKARDSLILGAGLVILVLAAIILAYVL